METGTIAALSIIVALLIAVLILIYVIRSKIKSVSRTMFGTNSFIEGVNKQKAEMSETPRSLHAMTSVYLPQILRDFPEFDYELYKSKAQSVLKSYFTAIETKKAGEIKEECSVTLKNNVQSIIDDLNSRGITQWFNQSVIHDIQVARYIKNGAAATILFNASVGYISYGEDENGCVVFGDKSIKKQTVYEIGLVYVQDVDKINTNGESVGINCPNCGAPIKNLGMKFCEYCGTSVKEVNIRSWKFDSINEQTVAKRQY